MRSGFVAVAGRPNVGKSTLVNALCGGKVAIVSDKPQTTRHRISGVVNGDDSQLVLVDLPGFQRPRDPLTEHMQRTVDASLEDVDAVLFVLPVDEPVGAGDRFIASRVLGGETPVVVAGRDAPDRPPRGLGLVGDDRHLAPDHRVDERRLADVRPSCDRDESRLHALPLTVTGDPHIAAVRLANAVPGLPCRHGPEGRARVEA